VKSPTELRGLLPDPAAHPAGLIELEYSVGKRGWHPQGLGRASFQKGQVKPEIEPLIIKVFKKYIIIMQLVIMNQNKIHRWTK